MFLKFPCLTLPLIMREKIIQKATEMFLNLGFKSVTMDDLAHEMGISKKTIYSHYKNKTDLVQQTAMAMSDFIVCGIRYRELTKEPY